MISVAMTTYNGGLFIEKQIESILNQTIPVEEIIIYDDGSKDNTLEVISSFNNPCIKVVSNSQNVGYIQNFYHAITACTGDFIFLSDQDDIWLPNKVEKCLDLMKETKADLICSNFDLIDEQGVLLDKATFPKNRFFEELDSKGDRVIPLSFEYLIYGNVLQGATFCITKRVQEQYKSFSGQTVYHDHQLMLIASKIGNVYFLNEPLIQYRIHSHNTIGLKKSKKQLLKELKIPKIEPSMVSFLRQLDNISKIDNKYWYYLYYYLRIPSLKNIVKTIK